MTSCPSPLWQPAGAPYLWEAFQDVHQSFKRMLKKYQHVSDSPNDPRPSSRSRGRPVAKFTKDPLLSSLDPKIFTTATHLAHFCLDTFSRDQDCLELSSKDLPTPTPILSKSGLEFVPCRRSLLSLPFVGHDGQPNAQVGYNSALERRW
jgi:hypothetical protein